jgi:hypothetical protein
MSAPHCFVVGGAVLHGAAGMIALRSCRPPALLLFQPRDDLFRRLPIAKVDLQPGLVFGIECLRFLFA